MSYESYAPLYGNYPALNVIAVAGKTAINVQRPPTINDPWLTVNSTVCIGIDNNAAPLAGFYAQHAPNLLVIGKVGIGFEGFDPFKVGNSPFDLSDPALNIVGRCLIRPDAPTSPASTPKIDMQTPILRVERGMIFQVEDGLPTASGQPTKYIVTGTYDNSAFADAGNSETEEPGAKSHKIAVPGNVNLVETATEEKVYQYKKGAVNTKTRGSNRRSTKRAVAKTPKPGKSTKAKGKRKANVKNRFYTQLHYRLEHETGTEHNVIEDDSADIYRSVELQAGVRLDACDVPKRDAKDHYGIGIEWEGDFARLQLAEVNSANPNGRRDTIFNWGSDHNDLLKFRFKGTRYSSGSTVEGHDIVVIYPMGVMKVRGSIVSYKIGYVSDERLKENITQFTGAIEKISALRTVTYRWREGCEPTDQIESRQEIGFLAQEVERILPEIVHTDQDGIKSVDYGRIGPILLEAVKEQQQLIKKQSDQIEALEQRIAALENPLRVQQVIS